MGAAEVVLNSGLDVMLHMTCINMTEEIVDRHLSRAKRVGIRNILALRGDLKSTQGQQDEANPQDETSLFRYALDLVKYIRKKHGKYFSIGVAGYPMGHPDAISYDEDLNHLKEKVDAGADFIITQLFFTPESFITFVDDCRKRGIHVPIIPGILPIQTYDSLRNIQDLSKVKPPDHIRQKIESIKNDSKYLKEREKDDAIRRFGVEHATEMCREILSSGVSCGLHFYTLNRELATLEILKNLGLIESSHGEEVQHVTQRNTVNISTHEKLSVDVKV